MINIAVENIHKRPTDISMWSKYLKDFSILCDEKHWVQYSSLQKHRGREYSDSDGAAKGEGGSDEALYASDSDGAEHEAPYEGEEMHAAMGGREERRRKHFLAFDHAFSYNNVHPRI